MTRDRITANLPSRNFDATAAFWGKLGFSVGDRDAGWMILTRGGLEVEFFLHPELDPLTSWFSACVRVDELDALFEAWSAAGLPETGVPRFAGWQDWGEGAPRAFALVDGDGSLLRVMGNGG